MFSNYSKVKDLDVLSIHMSACLSDLQRFKDLYQNTEIPQDWLFYIREGFKNLIGSYYELVKLMIYLGNRGIALPCKSFEDHLSNSVKLNTIPANSVSLIESLRVLRNENAHNYDIPEFEELYYLFLDNEEILVELSEHCKLLAIERKSEKIKNNTRRMNL